MLFSNDSHEILNGTGFGTRFVNESCSGVSCPALSSGPGFLLQSVVLLGSATFSLPGNFFVVDVLRTSSCVHPNVRLLLFNVGIANVLTSLHYIGQAIYNLFFYVEIFALSDYADWPVATQLQCALFQVVSGVSVYCLLFSMTGIVVERFLALTLRQSSFRVDRESSEIHVRVFAVLCWLVGIAFMFPSLFRHRSSSGCICYCHSVLLYDRGTFYTSLVISLLTEFLSIILCVVVRRLSVSILATAYLSRADRRNSITRKNMRRMNSLRKMNSLTERYQLNRNVNTMSMLYPSLISHSTFYILALSLRVPAHTLLSAFRGVSEADFSSASAGAGIQLLLVNMQFVNMACCLHPFLLARNNAMLAKALSERWPTVARLLFRVTAQMAAVQAARSTTKTLHRTLESRPNAQCNAADTYQPENPKPKGDGQKSCIRTVTDTCQTDAKWAVAQEKAAKRNKASVTYNDPMVTEYRAAAGAHEMVWEKFWKH